MSEESGVEPNAIRRICNHYADRVERITGEKVAATYDRVGERIKADPTRYVATKHWPLPAEWDDIDNDTIPVPWRFHGKEVVAASTEIKEAARTILRSGPEQSVASALGSVLNPNARRVDAATADWIITTARNIKPSTQKEKAA